MFVLGLVQSRDEVVFIDPMVFTSLLMSSVGRVSLVIAVAYALRVTPEQSPALL